MKALALLTWLRFRGWWRRLGRNVATVRGAIFVAFGILLSGCWVVGVFSPDLMGLPAPNPARLETVRRFAPLFMLGYCLLTVLTSAGDRALSFNPAEVNLLFAGPFTRRQLLAYKILTAFAATLVTALVFTMITRVQAASLSAAFLALVLALFFLQLFGIAVALVSESIGQHASTAPRRLLFVLLAVLGAAVLFSLGREAVGLPMAELLARIEASPVLHALLTPFRWFGDLFTARHLWPDLVEGAALCLAVDAVLLGVVFLLDAHYLEAAAGASERTYRRLELLRSGPAAAMSTEGGHARFSLPSFPTWGGVGPVAWRQALTALRNLKGLVFILLTFAAFMTVTLVFQQRPTPSQSLPGFLVGSVSLMSVLLLQLLTFDFRSDIDRMDVLKSLPISATGIVLGQLLTPVAMASGLQVLSFAVVELTWGGLGHVLWIGTLFVVPFNFLLYAVMNLLFLWFPTRTTPATAGDFQMMGRQMMLFFGIYALVFVLAGIPAAAGAVTYALLGGHWGAGLGVAWVLLVGIVAGLVPLIALAFRNFDVARDTPP